MLSSSPKKEHPLDNSMYVMSKPNDTAQDGFSKSNPKKTNFYYHDNEI